MAKRINRIRAMLDPPSTIALLSQTRENSLKEDSPVDELGYNARIMENVLNDIISQTDSTPVISSVPSDHVPDNITETIEIISDCFESVSGLKEVEIKKTEYFELENPNHIQISKAAVNQ